MNDKSMEVKRVRESAKLSCFSQWCEKLYWP